MKMTKSRDIRGKTLPSKVSWNVFVQVAVNGVNSNKIYKRKNVIFNKNTKTGRTIWDRKHRHHTNEEYDTKENIHANLKKNIRNLYILVQNSLFGQEGMLIEELADIMEVSVPSVRKYINNIDKNMLIISQVEQKKGYDFNLDYFDYDE